jgi:transketolase
VPLTSTDRRATDQVAHLADRARFVRTETVRLTRIAGAGHYSAVFSCAELFSVLYYAQLRLDPARPDWPDRDRFVLSKGHAAIGLYPVFGDHPDMRRIPGVDFSSGSLGHGLSIAAGMALAGRMSGSDHRTYCLLGDGELAEGQIWEAAMSAGHFRLGNLVAIVDANQLGIDGFVRDVMAAEPVDGRFAAFGWQTHRVDGHDIPALLELFAGLPAAADGPPQLVVADTVKGKGVARMELSPDWHVGNLVGTDYDDVLAELEGRA